MEGSSDTETLLECFDYIGVKSTIMKSVECFLCLLLIEKNKLYLIRDRAGEKPLIMATVMDGRVIYFWFWLAALRQYHEITLDKVYNFFLKTQLYSCTKSIYKNIYKLPPAHILELDLISKEIKIEKYWDYRVNYKKNYDYDNEHADKFLEDYQ